MNKDIKKGLRKMPLAVRAEKAFKEAVANAITEHKRAGVPITIWHDGKVVQIPPDQIEVHEEQTEYEILPKSGKKTRVSYLKQQHHNIPTRGRRTPKKT